MNDEIDVEILRPAAPVEPKVGQRSVLAETTGLVALSVLSPIAGLTVEMVIAWRFGTSAVVDAYRIAVLLVLFGQQVFVTSILPYAIVPIFAGYRAEGKDREAWAAVDSVARILLLFGALIALFLFVFPGFVTKLLAPGLEGEGKATTIFFIRWCGLAFIPLCWSGVACGTLYAHQIFRVAPLAQLMSNVAIILAVTAGGAVVGANSVVLGVVAGALGSAILYAIQLRKVRHQFAREYRTKGINLQAIRKLIRLIIPLLGGVIVGQASGAVVTRALSRLVVGSLAAFGYGWKLGQIVVLTPNALSTVLFPRLSETWHSSSRDGFTAAYVRALRAMLFIAIPLTSVAYAFREPIVALLLQRGAFTASAGHVTAALFGLLILGAPGNVVATYLDRVFYATQETALPVAVDVACALGAMLFVPVLARRFGASGVAIAYMLLPWITGASLLGLFQYKHGGVPFLGMGIFSFQVTALAAASTWLGQLAGGGLSTVIHLGVLSQVLALAGGLLLTGGLFLAATSLVGLPESLACWGYMRRICRVGPQPKGT